MEQFIKIWVDYFLNWPNPLVITLRATMLLATVALMLFLGKIIYFVVRNMCSFRPYRLSKEISEQIEMERKRDEENRKNGFDPRTQNYNSSRLFEKLFRLDQLQEIEKTRDDLFDFLNPRTDSKISRIRSPRYIADMRQVAYEIVLECSLLRRFVQSHLIYKKKWTPEKESKFLKICPQPLQKINEGFFSLVRQETLGLLSEKLMADNRQPSSHMN